MILFSVGNLFLFPDPRRGYDPHLHHTQCTHKTDAPILLLGTNRFISDNARMNKMRAQVASSDENENSFTKY